MEESYREFFRAFFLEYNNGRRWSYVLESDETDDSPLANLFGTTKQKLTDLMLGAKLAQRHGKDAPKVRLLPDNIKGLCAKYHIDNELNLARLTTCTSTRRVICIGNVTGPKMARNQFSDEYPNPP
jgi:hypothetical protein